MKIIATGDYAVAEAVKQASPGVIAAYPITPQTEIVERIAQFVARGEMACDYIPVESEHSAMAACIGASAVGVRAFTATSSQGLLYMHELLHWAAGARLPVVMANVNRAVGPPWNVWADHTDSLSQRDTGWLQVYAATAQEAYDATLMAFRIAEDERVLLPVMVNLDGFLLSHTMQDLETLEPGNFIPPPHLPHAIDTAHPAAYAPLTGPKDYYRFRWDMERSMRDARAVIAETEDLFAARFGRRYGVTEEYRCEDADVVVIALGTLAREAEVAVDSLRNEGTRAGVMRIRWFRPFPILDLTGREVVVIDRDYSFGFGGVLARSIRATTRAEPYSVIAGLGGQEVTHGDIATFVRERQPGGEHWFGVKAHV
ncbi:MAG TPA: transketolase C-terminal domain-containing protein [Methanomicrobiales archaeon]|nr:transketolase C-terminal domain-containing protein [Methanomicrobiales archaeon]